MFAQARCIVGDIEEYPSQTFGGVTETVGRTHASAEFEQVGRVPAPGVTPDGS
jgi:hypothetical protein